ncbi:MAG: cell division protein FtsH [Dehalococcoidales bacterium]|nr:cell division protein FtsH [Dehalococcoidales bacterium]
MFTAQQARPQQYQYGTIGGYYPLQTDWTAMISAFMPMVMMVMMLAIVMPMMKNVIKS